MTSRLAPPEKPNNKKITLKTKATALRKYKHDMKAYQKEKKVETDLC